MYLGRMDCGSTTLVTIRDLGFLELSGKWVLTMELSNVCIFYHVLIDMMYVRNPFETIQFCRIITICLDVVNIVTFFTSFFSQ